MGILQKNISVSWNWKGYFTEEIFAIGGYKKIFQTANVNISENKSIFFSFSNVDEEDIHCDYNDFFGKMSIFTELVFANGHF